MLETVRRRLQASNLVTRRSPLYASGVIDTEAKLAALLPQLRTAAWLALDTEADSLHAYPEKVCLIQISTAGSDELVDPLAPINLDPLFDVFNAHELIFHAADYDLRLLEKHHQFTPSAIFDTMLAARRGKISRCETGQRFAEGRLGTASAHGKNGDLRPQRHTPFETARGQAEA
jgi:hypothetical protein